MRSNEGFPADPGDPPEGALAATLGLVYADIKDHRAVMDALTTSKAVQGVEFSVQAPLYKGSPQIVDGLRRAASLKDKIDVYFDHALVDEAERVRFAQLFAQQYAKKHPRSERQDMFLASGDVFAFSFDLVPPMQLDVPREAFDAIAKGPHEAGLLARLRGGDAPDRWHLKAQIRVFLAHVLNPRRHDLPDVIAAARALGQRLPCVLEVSASPSIPGYARWVLAPLVEAAGGKVVWLPT
jgi:hypothetical protein